MKYLLIATILLISSCKSKQETTTMVEYLPGCYYNPESVRIDTIGDTLFLIRKETNEVIGTVTKD